MSEGEQRGGGERALGWAAGISACLAAGKFAVGLLTGSLVVMASAADSAADTLMSGVNLLGYRHARTPADPEHPYGHGKLEGALAVGQGMLLLGMVVSLAGSCVVRLVEGHAPPRVDLAVAALVVSGLVATLLTLQLRRAARRDPSLTLQTDTAHYAMDSLTAAGAVTGLVLVQVTGLAWLDPLTSLLLTAVMARDSARLVRQGLAELLDEALPAEQLGAIEAVLRTYAERLVAFHGLRTRRSGPIAFVEVHVDLSPELSLGEVHALKEELARALRVAVPGARVLVHPDAAGMEDTVDDFLEQGPPG